MNFAGRFTIPNRHKSMENPGQQPKRWHRPRNLFVAAALLLGVGFALGETIPGGIAVLLGIAVLVAWILQLQKAFYPGSKHTSLRLTSFQTGTVTTGRKYGYYALVGLLGGAAFSSSSVLLVEIIGEVLGLAGLAFGIAWLVLMLRRRGNSGKAGHEPQEGQP